MPGNLMPAPFFSHLFHTSDERFLFFGQNGSREEWVFLISLEITSSSFLTVILRHVTWEKSAV